MSEKEINGRREEAEKHTRSAKDAKRAKFEAKQKAYDLLQLKQAQQQQWMDQHSNYCTHVSVEDVLRTKAQDYLIADSSLANLLNPYLDLKDGIGQSQNQKQLFIAEGTETVRLLIQQCGRINILSILVRPTLLFDPPVYLLQDIEQATLEETNAPPFRLLVASEKAQSECAGFHISRGALACGVVPSITEEWLNELITTKRDSLRILALDGISDTANMGSMVRCAAAFGIDVMVLSDDCCDAWYRRSVRVSMGHVFHVPIVRVNDLSHTICRMKDYHSIESFAGVVESHEKKLLVLENIQKGDIPSGWCCVVGNEGNGISKPVIEACTHELRIGMACGVDSLSVPIATGILLHGLKERERGGGKKPR